MRRRRKRVGEGEGEVLQVRGLGRTVVESIGAAGGLPFWRRDLSSGEELLLDAGD